MEALHEKCARLRRELERAYEAWMRTSESRAAAPRSPIDVSGCPDGAKAEWLGYLAAEDRLIEAYAELPLAV
jgi:hypothetical protein